MSISVEFKKRFRELVSDMDCDKSTAAKYLGITYFSFERAFNYGIFPSPPILMRIADKLNISVEYLTGKTDNILFEKTDTPVHFIERFELLRENNQVTYYQIYKSTSIGTNYISNWKKQKSIPTLEHLLKLSEYFKVTVDYLLGRTDDKYPLTN